MKVVKLKYVSGYYTLYNFHPDITLIIIDGCNDIIYFCKDSLYHNESGPALVHIKNNLKNNYTCWYYNGKWCGEVNDFTNETWKKKVKELKHEEKLKIFK